MKWLRRNRRDRKVVVVSGLPRSGTSMMMQMLQAGGMPILTDDQRSADVSNPLGYYEYAPVKRLHQGKTDWVKQAHGMAVKVVSPQLMYLPPSYQYRVVFMHRALDEVLRSQTAMRAGDPAFDADQMRQEYERHLVTIRRWLDAQDTFTTLHVHYYDVLQQPKSQCERVAAFLYGVSALLDMDAMQAAVDPALHRQRGAE